MTALSTLFPAAGGGVPYPSAVPQWILLPNSLTGTSLGTNTDYLVPFVPRADVTVDSVDHIRANGAACNTYVGIYDASGNLLTDCALDNTAAAGLHQVDTTNVDLTAGSLYYYCLNQSVGRSVGDVYAATDAETYANAIKSFSASWDMTIVSTLPAYGAWLGAPISKARTNAALLSSLTMSGWDASTGASYYIFPAGFTPA